MGGSATCWSLCATSTSSWCSSRTAATAARDLWAGAVAGRMGVALDAALADAERWVVQQLVAIPVREFPVLGPTGRRMRAVLHRDGVRGHATTAWRSWRRASQKQVVNVAQQGGLCGVMVSRSRPAVGFATA